MKKKIHLRFYFVGILATILTAVLLTFAYYQLFTERTWSDLRNIADILDSDYIQIENIKEEPDDYFRITLIQQDGTVLYDNEVDKSKMENHLNREEIQETLKTGSGQAVRKSDTVGKNTYYYATLMKDKNILRVALETQSISAIFFSIVPFIVGIVLVIIIICYVLSKQLTKGIVNPIEKMASNIDDVVYEELNPFSKTIHNQQNEIKSQSEILKKEQNKIEIIVENMSEGFLMLDENKDILIINNSLLHLLNREEDEFVGRNVLYLTRNKQLHDFIECAEGGTSVQGEVHYEGRQFHVICNPVMYDKKLIGVICFVLDVTEKREMDRIKQEFTANVSHELKTPLTSILGYAQLISNGMATGDDITIFSEKICSESERLITLIGDIMQLSELEEPSRINEFEKIDLYPLIEECVNSLELHAAKKKIEIQFHGSHEYVNGNKRLLSEVVYNLCDNAIRYNKQDGKIDISLYRKSTEVVLEIRDTGIGIASEHLGRIFERFYRVDKSRSKATGGTGLGLAIVKHIIEQHGARITIESRKNIGTTIAVIFNI